MTKVQGWIIVALLAFVALNVAILDYVVYSAVSGFATSVSEMPTDFPTDMESGSIPTSECDIDPTKCD